MPKSSEYGETIFKVGYNGGMGRIRRYFEAIIFALYCWGISLIVLAFTTFGLLRHLFD